MLDGSRLPGGAAPRRSRWGVTCIAGARATSTAGVDTDCLERPCPNVTADVMRLNNALRMYLKPEAPTRSWDQAPGHGEGGGGATEPQRPDLSDDEHRRRRRRSRTGGPALPLRRGLAERALERLGQPTVVPWRRWETWCLRPRRGCTLLALAKSPRALPADTRLKAPCWVFCNIPRH